MRQDLTIDCAVGEIFALVTPSGSPVQAIAMPDGAASVAVQPRIVWRDDGTGDALTWADVMTLIAGRPACEIFVDQSGVILSVPAGSYSMFGAYIVAPPVRGVGIDCDPAAFFDNLAGIRGGVQVGTASVTSATFTFSDAASSESGTLPTFELSGPGCVLQNNGVQPCIDVAPDAFFLLRILDAAFATAGSGPIVRVNPPGVLFVNAETGYGGGPFSVDAVSGDGNLVFLHDGTPNFTDALTLSSYVGAVFNVPIGQDGGYGPTTFRPQPSLGALAPGLHFFDSTIGLDITWSGNDWSSDAGYLFPDRVDCSVNAARVENVYSSAPILHTQAHGAVAGGFNGAGTGSKSILGFATQDLVPLSSSSSVGIAWTWRDLDLTNPRAPYANMVIDINGDGSVYKIFVVDPASNPLLLNGATVVNPDGTRTTSWDTVLENVLVVNLLAGVVPDVSLGVPWPSNSFKLADILATYPNARYAAASSLDAGLPIAPNVTPAFMLILGDSTDAVAHACRVTGPVICNGTVVLPLP